MTSERTEELIVELVAGLAPVPRLAAVSIRVMRWLAAALLTAVAAVWFIGLRGDVSNALTTPAVLMSVVMAVVTSGSAAAMAVRCSVPGADRSAWLRWLPGAIVAVWVAALTLLTLRAGVSWPALIHEPFHGACIGRVVAISLVPTILLVREVRRGFSLDAVSAVALAALGGGALAALSVQLVCPIDRPAHVLVSHVLPILGMVLAAAAAARTQR